MPSTLRMMIVSSLLLYSFFAAQTSAIAQTTDADEGPEWLRAQYLNTVLSLQNVPEMRRFYGEILELESLPDIDLPARVGRPFDTIMIRFKVGRSQIKMIPHENLSRLPGGREAAAGLRVLSIPVVDGEAVAVRIGASNGTKPEWKTESGYRVAWVRDPDDNEIELRWYPKDAPADALNRLELAVTTNDIDAARRHYGQWLGLTELESASYAGFPGSTYRFRVGDSLLRLWSPGRQLPDDTGFTKDGYGLRYIQFIVKDADSLHQKLKPTGLTIAQEPTPLGAAAVLLFLADPDGTINECVGPARAKEGAPSGASRSNVLVKTGPREP